MVKISHLKYIVTGTGRCGTVFFSRLLTNSGISCGHETIFSFDGFEKAKSRLRGESNCALSKISKSSTGKDERSWFGGVGTIANLQADSSYMVAPFIDDYIFQNTSVIHLVRKPMEVINSFVEGFGYFRDACMHRADERCYHSFIYKHAPRVLDYSTPLDRAAAYYIEWNKMIEEKSKNRNYFRFNMNNKQYDKLFKFLNIEKPEKIINKKLNERFATNKYKQISQIPAKELRSELYKMYCKYFYVKI